MIAFGLLGHAFHPLLYENFCLQSYEDKELVATLPANIMQLLQGGGWLRDRPAKFGFLCVLPASMSLLSP